MNGRQDVSLVYFSAAKASLDLFKISCIFISKPPRVVARMDNGDEHDLWLIDPDDHHNMHPDEIPALLQKELKKATNKINRLRDGQMQKGKQS